MASALGAGGGVGGGGVERRYSVPSNPMLHDPRGMHSEDLHAWSIYRQNLNSDFTDSALGSTDKSPLPYGNFQLRDTTVQSILAHPRYGPKSALGSNMYTYLKFGLPRVFPPNHNGSQRSGTPRPKTSIGSVAKPPQRVHRQSRGMRETSSGYDSSDNETTTHYKNSRKYRSDPDFRMQNVHPSYQPGHGVPLVAMQAAGIRSSPHWNGSRHKSVSEANLLGIDARPHQRPHPYHRRGSVAEFPPDGEHQSYLMSPSHIGSRISKAGSHLSLAQSRKLSTLRPGGDYVDGHGSYIYPNYYVNNLEITSPEHKSMLLVSGLSFEVKSGEVLGVLATSQQEATGLLDVLAGARKKLSGELVVNGQPVAARTLRRVAGYVRREQPAAPSPHMSVQHALAFHAALRCASARTKQRPSTSETINLVVEELGLEQVRDTAVGRLTRSERRRLDVACQLLLDTSLLILDQPALHMDIFDTFFLVDYLRNWAAAGRIVILSIHPPTYEIFAMLTKVVLTSAGRTMYSGYRRDMLPYFSSIDYPCPTFKNPSDYYLDLVTLDDLSAAAMLESSSRIEALAAVFAATRARDPPPDPPPPVPLPPPLHRPNVFSQAFALLTKSIVYTQMHAVLSLISRLIVAAILSLVTGAIFWDLPSTDAKLTYGDRTGYHYTVMCVCVWPLLLLTIRRVCTSRRYAERDIQLGLYSRAVYILLDTWMSLFSSSVVWLAYLVPSYAMSGLYTQSFNDFSGFYYYLGFMLVYLLTMEAVARASAHVTGHQRSAAVLCGALFLVWTLGSGVLLHTGDMTESNSWAEQVSPVRWALPELLRREVSEKALRAISNPEQRCTTKQRPYQEIIVQSSCPLPNGTQALANYDYIRSNRIWESKEESFLVALAVVYGIAVLLSIFAFVFDCARYLKSHEKRRRKGHKTTPNLP